MAIKEYESADYKKAISLFEKAIDAGLRDVNNFILKKAYCKLYFCALETDDRDRINKYESKCSYPNYNISDNELKIFLKNQKIKFINNKNNEIIYKSIPESLEVSIPENNCILTIENFRPNFGFREVYLGPTLLVGFKKNNQEKIHIILPFNHPKFDEMRKGDFTISIVK